MNELTRPVSRTSRTVAWLALVLSILAVVIVAVGWGHQGSGVTPTVTDTSLSDIISRGVLRVGYGSYPPYTSTNLTKGNSSAATPEGFSIDLIKTIAAQMSPPVKVEFFPFSWDTLGPEVARGKFDVIVDPVFQTIPRAEGFMLLEPYSYFGIGAAVVRKDDNRFAHFEDLDNPNVTIALAVGWTTSDFAMSHLTKPHFNLIPVTGNAFNQLDEVTLGRADVALNDVPTVAQYVAAHSDTVKALWLNSPPSSVPGGFLVRKDASALGNFFNTALRVLIADGTVARLDKKWQTYGFIPAISTQPGQG